MTDTTLRHRDLDNFPVTVRIPVQWGELDAYGHLNNTMVFRYFESARIAFLERCGFIASYDDDRIGAILHSTECRFRRPLYYPDTVLVGGRVLDVSTDRFTMEYRVVSLEQDQVAADGRGIIVSFDYNTLAKTAIPEAVREGILTLESA